MITRVQKIAVGISVSLIVIALIVLVIMLTKNTSPDPPPPPPLNKDGLFNVVRFFPDDHWEQFKSDQTIDSGIGNQSKVNDIFSEMGPETSEFSKTRYALAFMPGIYNISFNVGFYTSVFGLGDTPEEVIINGSINVPNNTNPCKGSLDNFWRSLENLKLNITPAGDETQYFSCSQAAPIRRLKVTGGTFNLAKFEGGCGDVGLGGYASGGFMADTTVEGKIDLQTQQQYFWQNSDFTEGVAGAWNFLSVGCEGGYSGANVQNECKQKTLLFTTIEKTPFMASKPYLVFDDNQYKIRVPGFQTNSSSALVDSSTGTFLTNFSIVTPKNTVDELNIFLDNGISLVFPPAVYEFDETIKVTRDNTVIIGMGYATIISMNGNSCIEIADGIEGVRLSGFLFEAGNILTSTLVKIGDNENLTAKNTENPHLLQDIFCRTVEADSKCTTMLEINAANTIVQHTWLWRADHNAAGTFGGLGIEKVMSDHGMVVNGNNITVYALFSEHHLKENVLWNGDSGRLYFLQTEWLYEAGAIPGFDYPSLRVIGKDFWGTNLGAYSFFTNAWGATVNNPIVSNGFVTESDSIVESAMTVFLNSDSGNGVVTHVINGQGQKSDITVPDKMSLCGQNASAVGSCSTEICNKSMT
jgi:hypothetical protein